MFNADSNSTKILITSSVSFSPNVFNVISERDWYIYVVTADMNPQDEFFRAEEMEAFNLYREPRYIGLLGEYAYGAMERAPTFPAGQIDQPSLMRFYKAIPEHIT